MKRTLFLLLIVVPATIIISLLADDGSGLIATGPTLARRPVSESRATAAASRPRAIALADGAGTELFIETEADVAIGGKPVRYARSFAAAASYQNERPGIVIASAPMLIFNAKPKSEHDVARMLAIDTSAGSRRAMRDLAAAFGSHSGIRARSARIEGDVDLARVSRVEFTGDVLAIMVDPEVPDDETRLETGKLVVEFDNHDLVGFATDQAFTISRPRAGDLVLTGRGLDVRVRAHRATLQHDVRIEAALGRKGQGDALREPFTLTTPGPIDLVLGARPGRPHAFMLAGSSASTAAGVAFTQGDLTGSADHATVVCGAKPDPAAVGPRQETTGSKIESLDLDGNVRILSPAGEAQGSNLHLTPADPKVFARLIGAPVTVRLDRRSSMLPARLGAAATLTTSGAVVISPVRAGPDGTRGRTFDAGPGVVLATTTASLEAASATAWKAEDPEAAVSVRAAFEKASGRDEEDAFHAARVAIAREKGASGAADRITLFGPYDVLHRPKRAAAPAGQAATDSRRDVPTFAGDPMTIKGGGSLEVVRPVLEESPMTVDVREPFHMEALGPEAGKPKGTLDADSAHAVLDVLPESRPATRPTRGLASFVAEKNVRVELPDRARARGNRLVHDGRVHTLTLTGRESDPAFVQRTIPGSRDSMTAATIVFHQDILLVVATGGVDAWLATAPLPWLGDAKRPRGQTVPTRVRAQRVTANLDAAAYKQGRITPTEMTSEVAVRIVQLHADPAAAAAAPPPPINPRGEAAHAAAPVPDRELLCDYARFDAGMRSGFCRGSPLRYSVVRTVNGTRLDEGITCPSMTLDQRTIVMAGRFEGLFHEKPFLPGKSLRLSRPESAPASAPASDLQPLWLRCTQGAVMDEQQVIADGQVEMEQGKPPLDGMRATSDEAIVFLDEKHPSLDSRPADSRPAAREVGLVVLRGHAKYASRDFDAACDEMKMNQVTKHAHLSNWNGSEFTVLIHRQAHKSDVWNGVSMMDVDFTDPRNPAIEGSDWRFSVPAESRRAGK